MHNTILLMFMMMLTPFSASAQFYTITKETEISGKIEAEIVEPIDIKKDTINVAEVSILESQSNEFEKNSCENILNARKSDDYKSRNNETMSYRNREAARRSTLPQNEEALPKLTIPNLLAEIKKNGIKYPKIVLAQAILETDWFKSSVCRNKHNLFGLTNPRTGKYYEFNHWTESVAAYYWKVQYRYKSGNYLLWLDEIGYAEDKTYIRALIKLLKQL